MFKIDFLNIIGILKAFPISGNHGFWFMKSHLTIKKMQCPERTNLKNGKTENG